MAAKVAIIKYHRIGILNENLFLAVLEAVKSKIKVPTREVSF